MNHDNIRTSTLLFVIFYILFPLRLLSQNYENRLYGKEENGKRYYVNIYNERITDAIYDNNWYGSLENNDTGWIMVKQNGLYGVIDVFGNELLPCIYETIFPIKTNLFKVRKDGTCCIIHISGEIILPYEYEEIANVCFDNNTVLCKKNGFWGGVNINTNNATIPFIYNDVCEVFTNLELICVESKEGLIGCINYEGKTVIPLIHSEAYFFNDEKEPYIVLKHRKDWYAYTPKGNKCKLGEYDDAWHSSEGMILVKKDGLYGYCCSKTGKNIIPCIYSDACTFYDGVALAKKFGEKGYAIINKQGEALTEYIYSTIHSNYFVTNSFFNTCTTTEGKYGSINKYGKMIIPFKYEFLGNFNKLGVAEFKENGKWGLIDKNNNIIIQAKYDDIRYTASEIVAVKKGEKWGYVDFNDRIICSFTLDEAYAFPEDEMFASIHVSGKKGYINTNGYIITPGEYASFRRDQYIFKKTPSDVDINIPVNADKSEQTFAVIIANEKYTETGIPDVPYASNDGTVFKEYCRKTLGIPSANIKYRENTTLNQIRYEVNWMKDIAEAYEGNAKFIVYYAGHGIPDESNSTAYLLPTDGYSADVRSAYSLSELYDELAKLPAQQVTVFMDACFSGSQRNGEMLVSSRGVAVKTNPAEPKRNMVILSAAQGDETAYQYRKKKHGMFTYFLLKKLQDTKGQVSLKDLGKYVSTQVKQCSIRENGKLQSPTIQVSSDLESVIDNLTL